MQVLLIVLLVASFLLAAVPIVWRLRRGRAFYTRQTGRALGTGQLAVGVLWVLWGAVDLGQRGRRDVSGLYAVAFGLLWCWQAVRRLVRNSGNRQ